MNMVHIAVDAVAATTPPKRLSPEHFRVHETLLLECRWLVTMMQSVLKYQGFRQTTCNRVLFPQAT